MPLLQQHKPQRHAEAIVYALIDPRCGSPFYVGVTVVRLCNRLANHITNARAMRVAGARCDRIRSILAKGLRPGVERLEVVSTNRWEDAERRWIAALRRRGFDLTNVANGGAGRAGLTNSPKSLRLQRLAAAGRDMSHLHTPEVRAKAAPKIAASLTGKKLSAEHRAALSRGHKGIRPSEETLRRRSESLKRAWARRKLMESA